MGSKQIIRIFVDGHVFDQEYQGSRTFIQGLYTALSKNPSVQLLIAAHDIQKLREIFAPTPNLQFLQYNTRSGWSRLLFNIRALLKSHQADFAHFQYIIPPRKNRKCKYVVTIHDVIFEEYPEEFKRSYRLAKKMLYGLAARKADVVTTVSNYSRHSIEKFLGVPADNITVVPNAVDEKYFQPYDREEARNYITNRFGFKKYILYVSRFEPRKNHAGLLKAFINLQLHQQGYTLVLVGHRSLLVKDFDELLNSIPGETRKSIVIIDDVSPHDMLQLYRAASLFVYPSKAEGFGIPPLESAALKVPVICSDASAMADFGHLGITLVNASDQEALENEISKMLKAPPDENTLLKIAEKIRITYTWERSAEIFYQLLLKEKTLTFNSKHKTNDKLPVS